MKNRHLIAKIYLSLTLVLLYVPIFYLIYFSFSSGKNMNKFEHFTFAHYQTLFQDDRLLSIFLETLLLALLSSLIATIIGTFGAIAINGMRRETHKKNYLSFK